MYTQIVELEGHIIDSNILPRVMDEIIDYEGDFKVQEVTIGRTKDDPSYIRMEVLAKKGETLAKILGQIQRYGVKIISEHEIDLEPAPKDGAFPEGFYSTTNLETYVYYKSAWLKVDRVEMDCGIVVREETVEALCVPVNKIRKGDPVVLGHKGIRVVPLQRSRQKEGFFNFMGSAVSSERPKGLLIKEIAAIMQELKAKGGKIIVVAGPAVIHTGAGDYFSRILEAGYVDCLFAGNALAVHDIESALLGTSLGVYLATGDAAPEGHSHHMIAINKIRLAGGIKQAVEAGILNKGVMYTCEKNNVDYILAGSIRDDGPLPDTYTDVALAQEEMRRKIKDADLVIMLGTMLHSIATGNLLPAYVKTVCVDINPAVVTKLVDRGSFQAVGLVSDVEWFLRELEYQLSLEND